MSHAVWDPVVPALTTTRRVIAFDIAGFGSTPRLPHGTPPTAANLVDGLEQSIRTLGLELPVDMVGNSLGGWMALEAARRGIARTVVAIGPAGLWKEHPASHVPFVFGGLHFMATRFPRASRAAMRSAMLRELMLAVPLSVGSKRMSAREAIRTLDDLASATALEEAFQAPLSPFVGGRHITVPVTVAFGTRDWILPRGSRRRH